MRKIYLGVNNKAKNVSKIYLGAMATSSYTELEYIESSGTQYIDTGFMPNQDTKIELSAQYTDGENAVGMIAGCRNGVADQFSIYWAKSPQPSFIASYNTTTRIISQNSDFYTRHNFILDKNVFTIDSTVTEGVYGEFQSELSLCLFALHQVSDTAPVSFYATARIYSCKIYDNGTLVRDLIPAKVGEDIGLYDKLNNFFYKNMGTGSFTAGEEIKTVELSFSARRVKKAYLGVNDKARLIYNTEFSYYDEADPLTSVQDGIMSASSENYAYFTSGYTTETYNRSLTYGAIDGLGGIRKFGGTATLEDTVIFAGGFGGDNIGTTDVVTYTGKVKGYLEDLSCPRGYIAGLTVGDYAVFVGGFDFISGTAGGEYYDYYSKSGTHSRANMPFRIHALTGANAGDRGLFYGYRYNVITINPSMGMEVISDSTDSDWEFRYFAAGAQVGDRAIFAGGQWLEDYNDIDNTEVDFVRIYNSSVTESIHLTLDTPTTQLTGVTAGDYAVFAGGISESGVENRMYYFDSSFTMQNDKNLKYKRRLLKAATVGSYLIFGGGRNEDANIENTEVYLF